MSKPVRYWCAAAVLAVGVVLMHVLSGSWMPALSPELQKPVTEPVQLSLGVKLVLMGYLVVSVAGAAGVVVLFSEGVFIRDQQRWAAEREAQQRLSDMERQIREEQLPEQERELHRQYQERQREIRREAQRRLGLPEEKREEHDRW